MFHFSFILVLFFQTFSFLESWKYVSKIHYIKKIVQTTVWEKIFEKHVSGNLIKTGNWNKQRTILNSSIKIKSRQWSKQIPKKEWSKQIPKKEDTQRANKHRKICSASYVIKGLQIEMTVIYHFIPFRLIKSKATTTPSPVKDGEQQKL